MSIIGEKLTFIEKKARKAARLGTLGFLGIAALAASGSGCSEEPEVDRVLITASELVALASDCELVSIEDGSGFVDMQEHKPFLLTFPGANRAAPRIAVPYQVEIREAEKLDITKSGYDVTELGYGVEYQYSDGTMGYGVADSEALYVDPDFKESPSPLLNSRRARIFRAFKVSHETNGYKSDLTVQQNCGEAVLEVGTDSVIVKNGPLPFVGHETHSN